MFLAVFFKVYLPLLCFFVLVIQNENFYPAGSVFQDFWNGNHWIIYLLDVHRHFGLVVIILYGNELGYFLTVFHKLCKIFLSSEIKYLVLKSGCQILEGCLPCQSLLLEVPSFWFGATFHLRLLLIYHCMFFEAYSQTYIKCPHPLKLFLTMNMTGHQLVPQMLVTH